MFDYVGCVVDVVDSLPNSVKNVHIYGLGEGEGWRVEWEDKMGGVRQGGNRTGMYK